MPIATLKFKLPEEQAEFDTAIKALDYKVALWDVSQDIFRAARKHGYSDTVIQAALESCGEDGVKLISLLENHFYMILSEYDIDLRD